MIGARRAPKDAEGCGIAYAKCIKRFFAVQQALGEELPPSDPSVGWPNVSSSAPLLAVPCAQIIHAAVDSYMEQSKGTSSTTIAVSYKVTRITDPQSDAATIVPRLLREASDNKRGECLLG